VFDTILSSAAVLVDPDPHQSDKLDPDAHPDPHQGYKMDPDPHPFSDDKPKCMKYEPI
jgi:hypothetical protein